MKEHEKNKTTVAVVKHKESKPDSPQSRNRKGDVLMWLGSIITAITVLAIFPVSFIIFIFTFNFDLDSNLDSEIGISFAMSILGMISMVINLLPLGVVTYRDAYSRIDKYNQRITAASLTVLALFVIPISIVLGVGDPMFHVTRLALYISVLELLVGVLWTWALILQTDKKTISITKKNKQSSKPGFMVGLIIFSVALALTIGCVAVQGNLYGMLQATLPLMVIGAVLCFLNRAELSQNKKPRAKRT